MYIGVPLPDRLEDQWVRVEQAAQVSEDAPVISIYTDGSKMDDPRSSQWGTGAGFAIFVGTEDSPDEVPPVLQGQVHLCHSYTVFLAEVVAIDRALREYHTARKNGVLPFPKAIIIRSDSQAAIQALASTEVHSKSVQACKRLLNATAIITPVHLAWVKAHASSHRNNWVDKLAKAGAIQGGEIGPFPKGDIPLSFLKKIVRERQMDRWEKEWVAHKTCRQTKLWFPAPNPGLSRKILHLEREQIGQLIRWLTGHNFLRRHCQIVDPDTYQGNKCRLCRLDSETAEHIIAECMALDYNRLAAMKVTHLVPPYRWDLGRLLKFLDPLAQQMEDTEAPDRMITVLARRGTRTTLLERVAVPRDIPFSP